MTTPNLPLLRKTLEYIETHPAEWDQITWARTRDECGTTLCFAGTAVVLAGYDIDWETGYRGTDDEVRAMNCRRPGAEENDTIVETAVEVLGLRWPQADKIFYNMTNDPGRLRSLVEDAIGERL